MYREIICTGQIMALVVTGIGWHMTPHVCVATQTEDPGGTMVAAAVPVGSFLTFG